MSIHFNEARESAVASLQQSAGAFNLSHGPDELLTHLVIAKIRTSDGTFAKCSCGRWFESFVDVGAEDLCPWEDAVALYRERIADAMALLAHDITDLNRREAGYLARVAEAF